MVTTRSQRAMSSPASPAPTTPRRRRKAPKRKKTTVRAGKTGRKLYPIVGPFQRHTDMAKFKRRMAAKRAKKPTLKTMRVLGTRMRPNRTYHVQKGYYTSRHRKYSASTGKRIKSVKRQNSPYARFVKANYAKVKRDMPNASFGQISREVAKRYRSRR